MRAPELLWAKKRRHGLEGPLWVSPRKFSLCDEVSAILPKPVMSGDGSYFREVPAADFRTYKSSIAWCPDRRSRCFDIMNYLTTWPVALAPRADRIGSSIELTKPLDDGRIMCCEAVDWARPRAESHRQHGVTDEAQS